MEMVRKGYTSKIDDVSREERSLVSRISTSRVDRDGDVLIPGGMDRTDYNGMVLWCHDYGPMSLPLGRNLWVKNTETDIIAKTQFSDLPFSRDVFKLYGEGILNSWSVGFIPDDQRAPTDEDTKLNPAWRDVRRIVAKWSLLEYSAVKIPANPDALTLSVGKSMGLSDETIQLLNLKEEEGEPWPIQKPYPNEHACRLHDPGDFQADSFRRVERDHEGKKYACIMGRLKGETTMTEQAYRYPKNSWSTGEARTHCKSHDGISFEPASAETEGLRIIMRAQPPKIIPAIQRNRRAEIEQAVKEILYKKRGGV